MGAAESSNVSTAITNVSNYVSNSTTANTEQANEIAESTVLNNCLVQLNGDFNVNASAKLLQQNTQIVKSLQNANVVNNIQQQMQQQATSNVGFMGIGYADAHNASNLLSNSTNTVTNAVNANANQYSNTTQKFDCSRSTIIANNVNIDFTSNSDFISSQTLDNTQVANLVNDVSQKVSQKATATVEGISLFLLIIVLLVIAVLYIIYKAVSKNSGDQNITEIGNPAVTQHSTPTQSTPTHSTPTHSTPTHSTPTQSTPTQSTTPQPAPSQSTTTQSTTPQPAPSQIEMQPTQAKAAFGMDSGEEVSEGVFTVFMSFLTSKAFVGSLLVVGIVAAILVVCYLLRLPPFFSKPYTCINNSAIGRGINGGEVPDCVDMKTQTISLSSVPVRYLYNVAPSGETDVQPNLVQMCVAQMSGQTKSGGIPNGGYTGDVWNNLANKISEYQKYADNIGIPNIPNPLVVLTKSDGSFNAVPDEYLPNDSGSTGGVCTPGSIAVNDKSTNTDISQCPVDVPSSKFASTKSLFSAIANVNYTAWNDYLNVGGTFPSKGATDTQKSRALFARFVLCDIIGNIDLHMYVSSGEYVKFIDSKNTIVIDVSCSNADCSTPKYPNDTYECIPDAQLNDNQWKNAVSGTCKMKGMIGVLGDRVHKFSKFMSKTGLIAIGVFVGVMILVAIGIWLICR